MRLKLFGMIAVLLTASVVSAQYPHPGVSPYARMRAAQPAPRTYTYGPRPPAFAWGAFGAERHTQSSWHRSYHGDWHQVQYNLGW